MAVQDLMQIVSPPESPLDGDVTNLPRVEDYLGTKLPRDYVNFIRIYGTGCFGDHTTYFWLDNALRCDYLVELKHDLRMFSSCRRDLPEMWTYDIFPSRPGFLPCGGDVDGGTIGWLVDGDPDSWQLLTKSRDAEGFESWEMPITAFLVRALRHEVRPEIWRPDFPEEIGRVTFVPGPDYHRSVAFRQ
jgi:hypothetical protein